MPDGEWVSAGDACRQLGVGVRALVHLVDDGRLRAEGVDGTMVFARDDVERLTGGRRRLWRHRRVEPAEDPTASEELSDDQVDVEVLEQAQLLARFVTAFEETRPGPCPVCGTIMRPSEWPAHVRDHR